MIRSSYNNVTISNLNNKLSINDNIDYKIAMRERKINLTTNCRKLTGKLIFK